MMGANQLNDFKDGQTNKVQNLIVNMSPTTHEMLHREHSKKASVSKVSAPDFAGPQQNQPLPSNNTSLAQHNTDAHLMKPP